MTELKPIDPIEAVGQIVTACEGWEVGKRPQEIGRVVAYADFPTFEIERPNGTRFTWRAAWCREPTSDELHGALLNVMKR